MIEEPAILVIGDDEGARPPDGIICDECFVDICNQLIAETHIMRGVLIVGWSVMRGRHARDDERIVWKASRFDVLAEPRTELPKLFRLIGNSCEMSHFVEIEIIRGPGSAL